jgi:hypothetical protein
MREEQPPEPVVLDHARHLAEREKRNERHVYQCSNRYRGRTQRDSRTTHRRATRRPPSHPILWKQTSAMVNMKLL